MVDFLNIIFIKDNSVLLLNSGNIHELPKIKINSNIDDFEKTELIKEKFHLNSDSKITFFDSRKYNNSTHYNYYIEFKLNNVQDFLENSFFQNKENLLNISIFEKKIIKDLFFFEKHQTLTNIQNIGITIDLVILTIKNSELKILLNKRQKEPFKNYYTLPGGFLDESKDLNISAKDILKRDTNLKNVYLEQLGVFGEQDRDPRSRVITISYIALIKDENLNLKHSIKYDDSKWISKNDLENINVGFDHLKIINLAFNKIKKKINYSNLVFNFLSKKFTISELQNVYEVILEKKFDRRNFKKKMLNDDIIQETKYIKQEGRMRPAKLFKVNK